MACLDFREQLIDSIEKSYGPPLTNVVGTPTTFRNEMYHPLSKFLQHVSRGDNLLICPEEVLFNSVPKAREGGVRLSIPG